MFIPQWFKIFLASWCAIGVALLFFSVNSSSTVNLRELDASIGLIKRPKNSRIIDVANYIFRPIKTEAFSVNINSDIPRKIEEIIRTAINIAIAGIINSILQRLFDFFDKFLNQISTWIGITAGIKDASATVNAAIGAKSYQISECLNTDSPTLAREIFAGVDLSRNETARNIADGLGLSDGSTIQSGKAGCGIINEVRDIANADYGRFINSLAAIRYSHLATYSQQNNYQGVVDAANINNFETTVQDAPTNPDVVQGSQEIFAQINTKSENEAMIENLKAASVAVACGVDSSTPTPTFSAGANVIPETSLSVVDISCGIANSVGANTERVVREALADAEQVHDTTTENIQRQAPADCKFAYLGGEVETGTLPSNLNFADAGTFASQDFSTYTFALANDVSVKTFNQEQCNSQNRVQVANEAFQTRAQTNPAVSPEDVASVDNLLRSVGDAISDYFDGFISTTFDSVVIGISNLASAIGNVYVSLAMAGAVFSPKQQAYEQLQDVQEEYLPIA